MADMGDKRWGGISGGRSQDWQRQQQQSWDGKERRVGINYNYTGPERRERHNQDRPSQVPQGEYGQTGGMGMRPNTSDAGRFGSTQNYPEGTGQRGSEQHGSLVGSERPYEDEDDDL